MVSKGFHFLLFRFAFEDYFSSKNDYIPHAPTTERRNSYPIHKSPLFQIFVLLIALLSISNLGWGQTQTFTINGTFTVPAGVTSLTVECWGGGGAGGGTTTNNATGGGGGAGGAYVRSVLSVTPASSFTVTVGAQRNGATTAGLQGNPSWFGTTGTVYAEGGAGGAAPNGGTVAGGIGSSASSIGNIVVFAGGNGADGTTILGGGAGGGAGSTGAGGNASGTTSGTGTTIGGGNGGAGITTENDGNAGSILGGGGGGAFIPDASNHTGGRGARGQVIITWDVSINTDYFRSRDNGNWNAVTTWESSHDGTTWFTATLTPNNNANTITILNGHTVTLTANVTVDQTTINAGGQVTINNGNTLTINNGTGTDLSVSGTMQTNSTSNNSGITTNGTIVFNSGGTYIHNVNGEVIPTSTWDANSICYVTGSTTTPPTGANQTFGNFRWNSNQTAFIALTATTMAIQGNLQVDNTGGVSGFGTQYDFAINQDISIGGNLIIDGGYYRVCYNANRTQNALNDVIISGGGLVLNSSDVTNNVSGTLNVAGNFNFTAGIINARALVANPVSSIIFNGTAMQTYTSGGTITSSANNNTINFTVNNGAYLQMGTGASPSTVTAATNGGINTFTLSSGATLGITSTAGITATGGGANGNIQANSTRTFNTGANYIYNGASAQVTGNGLTGANNFTIDNSSGVTLSVGVAVSGTLSLTSGLLTLEANNLTINSNVAGSPFGSSNMIVPESSGNVIRNFTSTGTYPFPVGSSSPAVYSPVDIVANTASSGSINVKLINNQDLSADYDTYLKRRWTVTASGITNYDITCSYDPSDVVGTESILSGAKYDAAWVFYNLVNTGSHQFSMSGLTSFSNFSAAGKLSVTASASPSTICNGASSSLTATASGGKTPYSYSWSPGGGTGSSISVSPTTTTTYTVTVTDNNGKTATANVTVTVNPVPSAPTTTGATICVGSATILSASGAGAGDKYKWYDAATGGTLLKTSTNNTDNTYTTAILYTTTNYWVSILSAAGCESSRTQVIASYPYPPSGSETTAGSDSWIGHIYDDVTLNSANYLGSYTIPTETFQEGFGTEPGFGSDDNSCFSINSGGSVMINTFSVKYRMNSTKRGLYRADITSDDGTSLTVDGTMVYTDWGDYAPRVHANLLFSLAGNSSLICEYYENAGQNVVGFENLVQIFSNTLSTNTTQTVCLGNAGSSISGDTYGALPAGITVSGTGYQWAYGSSSSGPWTNISGATSATYTPTSAAAPFNSAGTYYIIRKAILSSTNNYDPNPYVASNESNAAEFIVNSLPAALSLTGSIICTSPGNNGTITSSTSVTGVTYQLYNSSNNAVGSSKAGTGSGLTWSSVDAGTGYYVDGTDDTNLCVSPNSNAVDVETYPTFTAGSIAITGELICYDGDPSVIGSTTAASGGDNTITYQWQYSTDVGWTSPQTIAGSNSATYDPPANLTQNRWYRRQAHDGTCNTSFTTSTGVWAVTINSLPQGSLAANGPFCDTGAGQLTWTASSGTGPYTVIYNDGTADRTANNIASGTSFTVFTTPVTSTTTYTLVSVSDANGCIRTNGFTSNSATITITTIGVTVDSIFSPECPQLTIGFEPDNSNYNSGYSEVRFGVERTGNSTANWGFDFNVSGATDISLSPPPSSWTTPSGTYENISDPIIEITVRFKNIENTFIDVVFEVTKIIDINGCNNTTSQSDNSSVLPMPALGPFQ